MDCNTFWMAVYVFEVLVQVCSIATSSTPVRTNPLHLIASLSNSYSVHTQFVQLPIRPDWTNWLLNEIRNRCGRSVIGRTDYWMKCLMDEVGLDEVGVDLNWYFKKICDSIYFYGHINLWKIHPMLGELGNRFVEMTKCKICQLLVPTYTYNGVVSLFWEDPTPSLEIRGAKEQIASASCSNGTGFKWMCAQRNWPWKHAVVKSFVFKHIQKGVRSEFKLSVNNTIMYSNVSDLKVSFCIQSI